VWRTCSIRTAGFTRTGARRDLECVAERAVGVRKPKKEIAVLVLQACS